MTNFIKNQTNESLAPRPEDEVPSIRKIVRDSIIGVLSTITEFISGLLSGLLNWIILKMKEHVNFNIIDDIKSKINGEILLDQTSFNQIISQIQSIHKWISNFIRPFIDKISNLYKEVEKTIISIVLSVFNIFGLNIEGDINEMKDIYPIIKKYSNSFINIIDYIFENFNLGFFYSLIENVKKVLNILRIANSLSIEEIINIFNDIMSKFTNIFIILMDNTSNYNNANGEKILNEEGNKNNYGISEKLDVWCLFSTLSLMVDLFFIGGSIGFIIGTLASGVGAPAALLGVIAFAFLLPVFFGDLADHMYFWELGLDNVSNFGKPQDSIEVGYESAKEGIWFPLFYSVISFIATTLISAGLLDLLSIIDGINILCGVIYQLGGNPVIYY